MADDMLGYKIREKLYPGEDEYFKANPNVTGMASETGDVILNPYSSKDVNRDAVAKNEAFRLFLREHDIKPGFTLTAEQQKAFEGTKYAKDEDALRSTIAARIYSGDPSANATPEQKQWVEDHKALEFTPVEGNPLIPGLLESGNIDLDNRPKALNPDGKISTVRSASFEFDGREVLLPTVSDDGRLLSPDEAIALYKKTGKHLGVFDTPDHATAYGQQLHKDQEAQNDVELAPVDGNPFAEHVELTPVEGNPFTETIELHPVEGNPFQKAANPQRLGNLDDLSGIAELTRNANYVSRSGRESANVEDRRGDAKGRAAAMQDEAQMLRAIEEMKAVSRQKPGVDLQPVEGNPFAKKPLSGKMNLGGPVPDDTHSAGEVILGVMTKGVRKNMDALGKFVAPLKRLFVDGGFAKGPDDKQSAQDMRDLLMTFYGGSAFNPAKAGTLYTFAGINAKTADKAMLAKAEKMVAEGATRDDIWKETGWFKGKDGKWRFEIDDSAATVKPTGVSTTSYTRLYEGLEHPELYRAYPELTHTPATLQLDAFRREHGRYGEWSGVEVSAKSGDALRSMTTHEVQHSVQKKEGFARGGNSAAMTPSLNSREAWEARVPLLVKSEMEERGITKLYPSDAAWKEIKEAVEVRIFDETGEAFKIRKDSSIDAYRALEDANYWSRSDLETITLQRLKDTGFGRYERLAGEVEARNVQTRRDMTREQRRATPPWKTQEIPDDEQIVKPQSARAKAGQ